MVLFANKRTIFQGVCDKHFILNWQINLFTTSLSISVFRTNLYQKTPIKSRAKSIIQFANMNETLDKELSFGNGQTVWSYIFLAILFFTILLNNSLVLAATWTQKHLQSQLNVIILASMAVGMVN